MSLNYLSRVSALTILALSIAACSSGGSHTKTTPNTPPLTDQSAAQKIEANRLVLLDKAKKAGLSDKQATAYAEANKEANTATAQAALETLVAEKAAADKAAADKAAADKAEKERLQKIEANRLVLLDKAKKAGLSDKQATAYAEANKEANTATAQAALEVIVAENENLAFEKLLYEAKGEHYKYPKGEVSSSKVWKETTCKTNSTCTETIGHEVIYNQEYSVVVGDYTSLKYTQSGAENSYGETSNIVVKGIKTEASSIPKLGSATYSGKAFTRSGNLHNGAGVAKLGTVNYGVNFESRKGSGVISLRDRIYLNEGSISGSGITSTAYTQVFDEEKGKILEKNGEYTLDFYGKKAEEIAGKVIFDGKDMIGFGGTRDEISK